MTIIIIYELKARSVNMDSDDIEGKGRTYATILVLDLPHIVLYVRLGGFRSEEDELDYLSLLLEDAEKDNGLQKAGSE